jgi:hypothetical protein
MGVVESSSFRSFAGFFQGPTSKTPSGESMNLPRLPLQTQKWRITVSQGKCTGQTMLVQLEANAEPVAIRIPKSPDNKFLRQGDTFVYTRQSFAAAIPQVYFSTLPYLPGQNVLVSRPVIWASTTMSEKTKGNNGELENGPSPEAMAKVMSILQSKLIEAALTSNRSNNAILGVQFQVMNDSFPCDSRHTTKQVTVVACGTPCSVVPLNGESSLELRYPESGLVPTTMGICATPVDTSASSLVLAEAIVLE